MTSKWIQTCNSNKLYHSNATHLPADHEEDSALPLEPCRIRWVELTEMSLERLGKFHKPLNMLKYNLFNKSIQLWFVPVPKSLQRHLKWSEPNWGELACSGLGRCISLHQVRTQLVHPASYSIVLDGIQLEAHSLTTSLLGPASCSHLLKGQQSTGLPYHPNDIRSCHLSALTTLLSKASKLTQSFQHDASQSPVLASIRLGHPQFQTTDFRTSQPLNCARSSEIFKLPCTRLDNRIDFLPETHILTKTVLDSQECVLTNSDVPNWYELKNSFASTNTKQVHTFIAHFSAITDSYTHITASTKQV